MKSTPLTLTLATVLALSTGGAALAQYRRAPAPQSQQVQTYEDWLDQQEDYRREQREYEEARAAWEARQSAYQQRQSRYQAQRSDYEARRAQWERDRAQYDRRYGYGAYVRRYGEWRYEPGATYAGGRYDNDGRGYDNRRDDYYADYRDSACERKETGAKVAGGIIGALAGAAIGSNVIDNEAQTEGTVLGALVGGAIGAKIGENAAKCDDDGYYYSYAQTYEYREPNMRRGQRSGRYDRDWYMRNNCRLAVAPTEYGGRADYRYVRVCPDRRGRYRITS